MKKFSKYDGKMVRNEEDPDNFYIIIDGLRHKMTKKVYQNLIEYRSMIDKSFITTLSKEEFLLNTTEGEPLDPEASLIKGSGPEVYLITNDVKRRIANA